MIAALHGIGDVAGWAALALALIAAWRVTRGGAGSAVQELSEANRVLDARVHELGGEVRDLRIENAELRERTDYAAVMAAHEETALERHKALLNVLSLIAARLGPDEAPGRFRPVTD